MKSIQNEDSLGAVLFNSANICLAHIATSQFNLSFLRFIEHFVKKFIDGGTPLSFFDPNDTGAIKDINDGGIFMPFTIRDLVNTNRLKPADLVPITYTGNSAME
jgi:hypothetical protein